MPATARCITHRPVCWITGSLCRLWHKVVCRMAMFGKKEIRKLLVREHPADINTMALNWLEQLPGHVCPEEVFGNPLEWLSLPGKKPAVFNIAKK